MKELYRGFFACDPPTSTAQQKGCSGGRYYAPPKLASAKRFWGTIAKMVYEKTGDKIANIRDPLFFHIAFCKPLLKKHKKGTEIIWHQVAPDCDNWVKLPQDMFVKAGVLPCDGRIPRIMVEKFYSSIIGVRITIGVLDPDDLPDLDDFVCDPQYIS